ncbi:asparagine synthase (glutamine-hydrolyzing) [Vampirovibrio chlorellavorus]|uniref:asparagine synthase (glutamine-hydrolyzing) n=1 Tax=Vampirovibrio chlorellavorus TaxID=758823 RepID=UPI0026E99C4D|nr:asparagine synthase (glutamine-hydrolyzing) [Vampirovibrio chlorellavorus]
MCGIAGVFQAESGVNVSDDLIWRMVSTIRHRGPDALQIWTQPGIALGHARLSIIDLDSRANQPMVDPGTGRVIVFNGEIYNYLELKEQLLAAGYPFQTGSDTEVILKAYDHWGVDCLNRFNGMWAFALYDPAQRTLFCARDRFGVKPFIYGMNGQQLVFASEAKAILSLDAFWREPNLPFLQDFIHHADFAGYEETFYARLKNLLPGHYFVVRPGETPAPRRYWDWQPSVRSGLISDIEALEEFQALFKDAIRLRFRSDVPVGACMSGGLDSTTMVGMATRLFDRPLSTFSCVYPDLPQVDESAYIREAVVRFDSEAHFVTPVFENLLDAVKQSIYEQDGPTGGPSVLSQRAVMRLAQGKVTVLLDGQGGDEVMGGYHSYFPFTIYHHMRVLRQKPGLASLQNYVQSRSAILDRVGRGYVPKWRKAWKKTSQPVQYQRPRQGHTVLDKLPAGQWDDLTTRMLEDLLFTLCNLLHYEDRNSMAFSLESRLPFLDYRLVQFMFSLPPQFKIRGARTKHLLYETAQDLIPPAILNRRDKMGFSTPGQVWFRRDPQMAQRISQLLSVVPEALRDLAPAHLARLRRVWQACLQGQPIRVQDEMALWRYVTACLWLEEVADYKTPQPLHGSNAHSPTAEVQPA